MMKRLLTGFLRFFSFKRLWAHTSSASSLSVPTDAGARGGSLPRAPLAPDWNEDCRGALIAFLRSPAGVCLLERWRAWTAEAAVAACRNVMHSEHMAGQADGWRQAQAWFESLAMTKSISRVSPRNNEGPEPARAVMPEGFTHYEQPLGETELREILSP